MKQKSLFKLQKIELSERKICRKKVIFSHCLKLSHNFFLPEKEWSYFHDLNLTSTKPNKRAELVGTEMTQVFMQLKF